MRRPMLAGSLLVIGISISGPVLCEYPGLACGP